MLTALNAYHIAYSQETRSYALIFMIAALSYSALVVMLHRPGWGTALSYGLTTSLAAHVHYYALVMFVGQAFAAAAALALRRDRWRDWRWSLLGTAIVALSVLPWIGPLRRVAAMDEYWPEPPDAWFLIDDFQAYFGGDPILSIVCGALLAAIPFIVLRRPGKDEEWGRLTMVMATSVLGASACVSLALAYARSVLIVPMLIPRFTIVFLPAILILIAIAIVHLRPRALGALDPGEEFRRLLHDHYACTNQIKFLKTSVERWERRAHAESAPRTEKTD